MQNANLFLPQQEVLEYGFLETGFHCLLNMATGSGKTYLAELAIDKCLQRGFKSIYLTPLKALADEKYESWQERFPGTRIGLFTGDTVQTKSNTPNSYRQAQILIMTPERLDACLRNWRSHWSWIPDIDLLVVDEFHLLGDPNRGPRLEGSLTRLMRINPFVRILGLSATLSNVSELSDWLQGVHYRSSWRQVPLKKEVVRFARLQDKLPRLIDKLRSCVDHGGKSIVFVNSRSRAQEIDQALQEAGFRSHHHHAGLEWEERRLVEHSFRHGDTQVLVCTSTIEMGLNLPARQVVLYDCYSFNGSKFGPLPVWSYVQRAGRAGRPGLDKRGEVVMFAPRWMNDIDRYTEENCEAIRSGLKDSKFLAEQVLIELSSGYSRTREDLSNGFLPLTLLAQQTLANELQKVINRLIMADMLRMVDEEDAKGQIQNYLRPTRIGRLAVRLMFSPGTIQLVKDVFTELKELYLFDLLLLACLSPDCSPVLPANYEDLEDLEEVVNLIPSHLLDRPLKKIERLSSEMPNSLRFLSGIKMAVICQLLIKGTDKENIAERYDLYPADIKVLKESIVRILQGISAVLKALCPEEEAGEEWDLEEEVHPWRVDIVCNRLANMLKYEIDFEGAKLTAIPGVGGKMARVLIDNCLTRIDQIGQCEAANLLAIRGIGSRLAQKMIEGARELDSKDESEYKEELPDLSSYNRLFKSTICPYRLRRSLELMVRILNKNSFLVNGGREDHQVTRDGKGFHCDCTDFAKRNSDCKHILATKKVLQDQEVCSTILKLKEDKNHPLRLTLSSLWFSISKNQQYLEEAR